MKIMKLILIKENNFFYFEIINIYRKISHQENFELNKKNLI